MMKNPALPLMLALAVAASPALAERADREKPITLEANRISVDDVKKVQVYEGNVVLSQGTLVIRSDRIIVTQDADGFHKGVATGGAEGLARFRQKRDNSDDYVEGEGERIEYNARNDRTQFFVRAWVKSGQDEVKGSYISYEAVTEKYLVTNTGGTTNSATGETQARVRAIIQPKGKTTSDDTASSPVTLTPAPKVTPR